MRSTRTAKHAKPSFHPTRTTLSTGLTAVLLPLCTAAPALAESAPTGSTTTTATSTGTATGATAPATTAVAPTPAPAPTQKAATSVRIAGPTQAVAPGRHSIGVRVMQAGDRPVQEAYVRIERWTRSGWAHYGRLLTGSDGRAVGRFQFDGTTRLRAVYQGSSTRAASSSGALVVTVTDFRQRALKVAAAQKGKPYRWGATGPSAFDCSGLMVYSFRQAGKSLPRSSRDQLAATQRLSQSAKKPGDLIFIHRSGRVSHVGVYAGNNSFWVAPKAGDVVKLQRIYTSSYYVGRVR